MEPIIWVIVVIIWIIYSAGSKNKKAEQKRNMQKPVSTTENKTPQTFKEIIEEMRRKAQEFDLPDAENAEPVIIKQKQAQKTVTNRQIVVQDQDLVSEEERKRAEDYKVYVEQQRKKRYEFVFDKSNDDPQVSLNDNEDTTPLFYDLDIKNIIITDAIMRRPDY